MSAKEAAKVTLAEIISLRWAADSEHFSYVSISISCHGQRLYYIKMAHILKPKAKKWINEVYPVLVCSWLLILP